MNFGFINVMGLLIILIMLVPNIIYAFRTRNMENACTSKVMNILEQFGRYSSLLLMVLPLGIWEFGFNSVISMLIYFILNTFLLLTYIIIWIYYFKGQTKIKALSLAIIPTLIFLISGITLQHYLLIISTVIFGIGHIYVTLKNSI